MALRLTPAAKDRLSELERSLERAGFTLHQASASEIIITLLEAADISDLRERLSRRFGTSR